jgi:hypothetical protein
VLAAVAEQQYLLLLAVGMVAISILLTEVVFLLEFIRQLTAIMSMPLLDVGDPMLVL